MKSRWTYPQKSQHPGQSWRWVSEQVEEGSNTWAVSESAQKKINIRSQGKRAKDRTSGNTYISGLARQRRLRNGQRAGGKLGKPEVSTN